MIVTFKKSRNVESLISDKTMNNSAEEKFPPPETPIEDVQILEEGHLEEVATEDVQTLEESHAEEIEDLTSEVEDEDDTPDETTEALEHLKRVSWTREAEKRNEEAAKRKKAENDFKSLEASEKMGKTNQLPDMTDQAEFADPKMQAEEKKDKEQMRKARKDIFLEKKAMEAVDELEAEQDAEKASETTKDPPKKNWLSRLFRKK